MQVHQVLQDQLGRQDMDFLDQRYYKYYYMDK